MQSTNKTEVFPGIFVGDIVVSLVVRGDHRIIDDIFEVLSSSGKNSLRYKSKATQEWTTSNDPFTVRKATPHEEAWYRSTYKGDRVHLNLKDMPKINNTYPLY